MTEFQRPIPDLHAIFATDLDLGFAKNGNIPWHNRTDMEFFRRTTEYHVIFMGMSTFRSLPKLLPNRLHVVLTHNRELLDSTSAVMKQLENIPTGELRELPRVLYTNNIYIADFILNNRENMCTHWSFLLDSFRVYVIGGVSVLTQLIPRCSTIWHTIIQQHTNCDLHMPDISLEQRGYVKYLCLANDSLAIYKYVLE